MSNEFSQFPDYQSLEPGDKSAPAKAMRSIPDRVDEYGLIPYVTGRRVLDLGCNRGYFGTYLSQYLSSYVGIEGHKDQLDHAQPTDKMTLLHMDYKRIHDEFDIILCLAFHSYVGISMQEFANDLHFMADDETGTIFLEGHPKGYRGEPEKYLDPLLESLKNYFYIDSFKTVTDRDLKRPFYILKRMNGMVSRCLRVDGAIVKKYYPRNEANASRNMDYHWEREIEALQRLNGQKHVPELLEVDADNREIKMQYCGDRITKENRPWNWMEQIEEIEKMQVENYIYHHDIALKNITVLDNVIYLIDWGLHGATPNPKTGNLLELISNL